MNRKAPLYWHQGMLLQPQHFQLESQFHQAHVARINQLLHCDCCGVESIFIQSDSLAAKKFVVSAGEFLFPDGSHCVVPESAVVASRQIDASSLTSGQSTIAYLGLKQWMSEGGNVTELEEGCGLSHIQSRYIVELDSIALPDLYGRNVPGHVRQIRFLLKIFWHTEIDDADDYLLMPVARLVREGTEFRICDRFIPPLMNAHEWPGLQSLLNDTRDLLVNKARQVECFKQYGDAYHQADSDGIELIPAVQALTDCAWKIQDLVEQPVLHPRKAWSSLSSIIAKLSCFTKDLSVSGVPGVDRWPVYDHFDLELVFRTIRQQLIHILSSVNIGPEYVFQMLKKDEIWFSKLDERALGHDSRYWLLFDGCTREQLISDLHSLIKLASHSDLSLIISRSISGIPLLPCESTPKGLPDSKSGVYCEIDTRSPLWDKVSDDRELGLYWIGPEDSSITLYITRY